MCWLVWLAGCDSCDTNPVRHLDGRIADVDAPTALVDASTIDASNPNSTMLITVSPPGPSNGNMATWGGVLQYQVAGDGADLIAGAGIATAMVHDPAGLAFRFQSSEIFVGNRHGNNSADGTAGSISRYTYTQGTHALDQSRGHHRKRPRRRPSGDVFTDDRRAVRRERRHWCFALHVRGRGCCGRGDDRERSNARRARIARRQTPVGVGRVERHPSVRSRHGNELASVTLQTTGNLHYFAFRKRELYVAALGDNQVYRYTVDANDDLAFKQAIAASQPIGIAFSADGEEMFVTSHYNADVIERYRYQASDDTWMSMGTINVSSSLGGIVIVPG